MTAQRLARIAAFALGFWALFTFSQQATLAREGTTLPGLSWVVGALSLLFLISAVVSERMQGPEANLRKDMLWGLAAGGLAIILHRL